MLQKKIKPRYSHRLVCMILQPQTDSIGVAVAKRFLIIQNRESSSRSWTLKVKTVAIIALTHQESPNTHKLHKQ